MQVLSTWYLVFGFLPNTGYQVPITGTGRPGGSREIGGTIFDN
jgi:hypothetical protein